MRISLSLATESKLNRLSALLREFRSAATFYAKSLWNDPGRLDAETLHRRQTGMLSYQQKAEALRMAMQSMSRHPKSCPVFKNAARFSERLVRVEKSTGSFDFVFKVTSLVPRNQIVIPFKSHKRLNYWLSQPGATLKGGAIVSEKWAWIYVDLPDRTLKTEGESVGLDIGFNKMIADSLGGFHGGKIKEICAKIQRRRPGSKGRHRAYEHRRNYINFVCRRLPWQTTKNFVLEDLTGLKVGKGTRGKRNRKLLASWSYRLVRTRLTQLAEENRVGLQFVNPQGTSQRCPRCGRKDVKNRVGEKFDCLRCHFVADSDTVGAMNILAKTTRNCPEFIDPVGTCGTL